MALLARMKKREELRCETHRSTCSVDLLDNTLAQLPHFIHPQQTVVAFTGQHLLSTLVEGTAALAVCATAMSNTLVQAM
jgi:hypothetical protein